MKCTYSPESYQWQNADGSFGVGKLVETEENGIVTARHGYTPKPPMPIDRVLIAHSHTRELEFIEFGKLSPYPPDGKPISQPTK